LLLKHRGVTVIYIAKDPLEMYKIVVANPLRGDSHFFVRIIWIIDKGRLCIRVIAIAKYLMTPTLSIRSQLEPED